jgi:Sulfotransferase domain
MPLSVIGAGLGRTGTLSLKKALEELGFGPCYHGLDSDRNTVEAILEAINRPQVDWEHVFAGYRAAVDIPTYWVYRELAQCYPTAHVILTVRDPNDWLESTLALSHSLKKVVLSEESLLLRQSLRAKMLSGAFGAAVEIMARRDDRSSRIAAYEQHVAEVRASIPQSRLLVFDVKEGWEPLCGFLRVPAPDTAFPRVNSRANLPSLLDQFYGREPAPET